MRKKILLVLLILLQVANIQAESTIWKLNSEGKEFYLAGSIHVLKKSDYPLPIEFETAYEKVDKIIFETFMDDFVKPEIQLLFLKKGSYQQGETLKDKLSEGAYKKLEEYCTKRSVPIDNLQQFKPWMLILTLTIVELQANGVNPADGMDLFFNKKAKKDGKMTAGLVSAKEHLEAISSFGKEFNDILIENYIEEMASLVEIVDELIKAWRTGDEKKIDEYVSKHLRTDYPTIYKVVIADRNRRWLEIIEELIRTDQKIMIIVGSGHLVGEDGLVKLLVHKGYDFKKFRVE